MSNKTDDDAVRYAQVPAEFPRPAPTGALPGGQTKFLMSMYGGRFYPAGSTPPEIWERWGTCEHLANQFSRKSLENKLGKRAHLSEVEILDQYMQRLLKTGWGHRRRNAMGYSPSRGPGELAEAGVVK